MFPELCRDDIFQLETARLWLRWPRAADAPVIAGLVGAADGASLSGLSRPATLGNAQSFVLQARAQNFDGQALVLALTRKKRPDEPLGVVSLRETAGNDAALEFWPWPMANDDLMAEAVQGLASFTFQTTTARTIHARVEKADAEMRQLLQASGFALADEETSDASIGVTLFALSPRPSRAAALLCA